MPDAAPGIPDGFAPVPYREGFLGHVGPLYEKRAGEEIVIGFHVLPHHVNPAHLVHGGFLTTVIDMAMAYNLQEKARGGFFVSLGLDVQFCAPGREGDWLEVLTEIPKVGRQNAFALARVMRGDEVLMAGSGVFTRWSPKSG